MKFEGVYEGMAESIKKGYGAGTVFGEPIEVGTDVTIIPVAKVKIKGGGGGGEEKSKDQGEGDEGKKGKAKNEGGGFGFMGGVKPVGYILISGSKVRWVGIPDMDKIKKCLIPMGICALVILKRKMLHMKLGKMACMRHGMGPHGAMMHGSPWAHGGMHKPPWAYGGMPRCEHGHMHGHMHGHHTEHLGGMQKHHHHQCEHGHAGRMKPPDWRARKRQWMSEKKAGAGGS